MPQYGSERRSKTKFYEGAPCPPCEQQSALSNQTAANPYIDCRPNNTSTMSAQTWEEVMAAQALAQQMPVGRKKSIW
jgi:hypothetical protein